MYDPKLQIGNGHKVHLNKILAAYLDILQARREIQDSLNEIGYQEGTSKNETLKGLCVAVMAQAKWASDYKDVFLEVKDLLDA